MAWQKGHHQNTCACILFRGRLVYLQYNNDEGRHQAYDPCFLQDIFEPCTCAPSLAELPLAAAPRIPCQEKGEHPNSKANTGYGEERKSPALNAKHPEMACSIWDEVLFSSDNLRRSA